MKTKVVPMTAVYPLSQKDANGDEYEGAKHNYVIRFEKGRMPPAEAFWSPTMYDFDFFFVPNPINRYDLAQRDRQGIHRIAGHVGTHHGSQVAGADRYGCETRRPHLCPLRRTSAS